MHSKHQYPLHRYTFRSPVLNPSNNPSCRSQLLHYHKPHINSSSSNSSRPLLRHHLRSSITLSRWLLLLPSPCPPACSIHPSGMHSPPPAWSLLKISEMPSSSKRRSRSSESCARTIIQTLHLLNIPHSFSTLLTETSKKHTRRICANCSS